MVNAQSLEEAAMEMRLRLGESLLREQNITQDLDKLINWLEQARQEEKNLNANLETLEALKDELEENLPAVLLEEARLKQDLRDLRNKYHLQLRAVYLYAPEVGEWVFASDDSFNSALGARQNLDVILQARLASLRRLQAGAARVELKMAALQARQEQYNELLRQLNLSREELAALSERRLQAKEQLRQRRQELGENRENLQQAQARLEKTSNLALPQIGASHAPSTDALAGKGRFYAPVSGTLLSDRRIRFSLLEAPAGAMVRAPWAGVIAFADFVPGYGHLLVIDHGQRLHSVLAHMSGLKVKTGDSVTTGQVVGLLDSSGLLYVEIRLAAKLQPVGEWLFKGEAPLK